MGAYAPDKNTSVRVCAKNAGGGAYAQGGAYLQDTTVILQFGSYKKILIHYEQDM